MPKKITPISARIDSLLSGLVDRLEKIEKVTVEQFPEVCKEIITERKVEIENSAIQMGMIALVLTAITLPLVHFSLDKELGDGRILTSIGALIAGGVNIAYYTDLVGSLLELRKLKAAPRVYVLKQLRKMIGSK